MSWELLFKELIPESPHIVIEEQPPLETFKDLTGFLKSSMGGLKASVFSSNNSLKSCYTYGDIHDNIQLTKETLEALMLDHKFDFEVWQQKRTAVILRTIFISRSGEFPDVEETLQQLRWLTLRLAEGYELRKRNLDLGMYVYQNLYAAEYILKDLDSFFMELFHEYRDVKPRHETTLLGG